MSRSPFRVADLKPEELELLHAMATEGRELDIELASCFLAVSRLRAGRMLDRLEHLGFLSAQDGKLFSLNRAAYTAIAPLKGAYGDK